MDISVLHVFLFFFTRSARHCCKQLKDTIPSWKKDFVANHFCHNAANSPNIHYICAALKEGEENKQKICNKSAGKIWVSVFDKRIKVEYWYFKILLSLAVTAALLPSIPLMMPMQTEKEVLLKFQKSGLASLASRVINKGAV